VKTDGEEEKKGREGEIENKSLLFGKERQKPEPNKAIIIRFSPSLSPQPKKQNYKKRNSQENEKSSPSKAIKHYDFWISSLNWKEPKEKGPSINS